MQQNISVSEEQAAGVTITKKDGFSEDVVVSIKDDAALSDMPSGQDTVPDAEVSVDGAEADTEQISVTIDFYNMLQLCCISPFASRPATKLLVK